MRARRLTIGACSLLGVGAMLGGSPAAGIAAGPWSTPQTLSAGAAAGTPTLAFDARGGALATWAATGSGGRRSASRLPSATRFGTSRVAPDIGAEVIEGLPPAPVVDASGGVVAVQQRKARSACGLGTAYTLTPRFGRVNGTFSPARGHWTIISRTEPPAVALAGDGHGLTLVAWKQLLRNSRGRCLDREVVQVAVRRPGGAFGAPVTLARAASSGAVAASVGPHGQMLVAWRQGQTLATRSRSARGGWGAVQLVSTGAVDSFAAQVAADGAACLIWTRMQPVSPEENPRTIGAAVRGAHATRFTTKLLERGTWPTTLVDRPERRAVRVALVSGGVLAAWTSWAGDHLQVLTAKVTGGRAGRARTATPPGQDYALGDLAASTAGRPALALTATASSVPSGPFVALGASDGSFATPEAVGPGAQSINGEALAFSPRTGRPTLVWTQFKSLLTATR